MTRSLQLLDLVSFELDAIEKGYQLIKGRPIFFDQPNLIFSLEDLKNGDSKVVALLSVNCARTVKFNALAPLLFIAGFKILDMIAEHILGIDPYNQIVSYREKVKRLEDFEGDFLFFDNETIRWIAAVFENTRNTRRDAIHRKTSLTGLLHSDETVLEFLESIYWLASLTSDSPIKQARAKFETLMNVQAQALTKDPNGSPKKRYFEIVKIEHYDGNIICYPEDLVRARLNKMYPDSHVEFFLLNE